MIESLKNTVIQGDCLGVMKSMPDKCVDMILCDLPYGNTQNKWDSVIDLEKLWLEYNRIIKFNGAIVLFSMQPFTSDLIISNKNNYKYSYVWIKNNPTGFLNAKKQPLRITEDVNIFYNNQCLYNPQKVHRNYTTRKTVNIQSNNYGIQNHTNSGEVRTKGYPYNILYYDKVAPDNVIHPTQKPVALFEYLIKTYTLSDEIVLDNTAGSGTTAIACLETGRNYILVEKEPEYVKIINKRIDTWKEQGRLFC